MSNNEEKAVVERIVDGRHAVLHVGEREEEMIVPVERLPEGVNEGLWLRVRREEGELVLAEIDETETDERRVRIREKMRLLRQRGA